MKIVIILISIVLGLIASALPAPGADAWYPQYLCLLLMGFLMAAAYIADMSPAIGLFVAYLAINTFFVANQNVVSLLSYTSTAFCLLMAVVISNSTTKIRHNIICVILFTFGLQVILGIVQSLNIDPLFHKIGAIGKSDIVGFSGSHNQYGLSLAASAVSLLILPLTFVIPLALLAAVCIYMSTTFTAILGLCAAFGFYYFNGKFDSKFMILVLIVIALIAGGLAIKPNLLHGKIQERIKVWKLVLQQSIDGHVVQNVNYNVNHIVTTNPLYGYGFGSFFFVQPLSQYKILCKTIERPQDFETCSFVGKFEHAHNDYLEVFFDLGYIGLALFMLIIWEMVQCFRHCLNKTNILRISVAGIIAYAVCALSIYTVHTAYSAFLLCIFIGLFYGEVKNGAKR